MFAKIKIKRFYRWLRRPFEWALVWTAYATIPFLSKSAVLRLARCIAAISYRFDRQGKAIAHANLQIMFSQRISPWREKQLVRRVYRNLAYVLVNVFWMSRHTRARMADTVAFAPCVLTALRQHLPAITVSAHLGNWEILSQACVMHDIPMMSIAKMLGSPKMTAHLTRLRSTIGQQIVPNDGALRQLIQALKNGTSIGLLIDQHVQPWEGGTWVNFFDRPIGVALTPAILARKYATPIVFAWSRPLKNGRYRIELGEIFTPDPTIDDHLRTQQIIAAFEKVIRRHPSLWCLNYRRWRHILPHEDPARYPFYAQPFTPDDYNAHTLRTAEPQKSRSTAARQDPL